MKVACISRMAVSISLWVVVVGAVAVLAVPGTVGAQDQDATVEHVTFTKDVAPEAPDWFGRFESPTGLTEDRWIKSVETKPSAEGFAVTHHAVTNIFDPETGERSFLNEYAIGKNGDIFPEGTGREIKAGSTIQFNMHYHAIGEEATDRTSVGLTFYPRALSPERSCSREPWAGTSISTFRQARATCATMAITV